MELKRIEKLIDLLRDKEVGELEYSEWEGDKGFNVRVSMVGEQLVVSQAAAPVAASAAPAATASSAIHLSKRCFSKTYPSSVRHF